MLVAHVALILIAISLTSLAVAAIEVRLGANSTWHF